MIMMDGSAGIWVFAELTDHNTEIVSPVAFFADRTAWIASHGDTATAVPRPLTTTEQYNGVLVGPGQRLDLLVARRRAVIEAERAEAMKGITDLVNGTMIGTVTEKQVVSWFVNNKHAPALIPWVLDQLYREANQHDVWIYSLPQD
jgi:hypothetical protein